jgi:hypothetical protein
MQMPKPDGVTTVENGSDANGFKCHQLTQNVIVSQQHTAAAMRRVSRRDQVVSSGASRSSEAST